MPLSLRTFPQIPGQDVRPGSKQAMSWPSSPQPSPALARCRYSCGRICGHPVGHRLEMEQTGRAVSPRVQMTARTVCWPFCGFQPLTEDKGEETLQQAILGSSGVCLGVPPLWHVPASFQSSSAPAKAGAGPTWQCPPARSCRY